MEKEIDYFVRKLDGRKFLKQESGRFVMQGTGQEYINPMGYYKEELITWDGLTPVYKKEHAKCVCEWCSRTHPKIKEISAALPEELKKDFDHLMAKMVCAEEDAEYWKSCYRGDWPGTEWIKEAKIAANIK